MNENLTSTELPNSDRMAANFDKERGPPLKNQEINIAEALSFVWKKKFIILGFSFITGCIGALYALFAAPVYQSEAIIAPKESGKVSGASAMLSQLGGGLGGMVAAQLGLGGGNLDWIEVMLKSKELAKTVIAKENLLPAIFPKDWDAIKNRWKREPAPDINDGIHSFLKNNLKVKKDSKKSLLTIGVEMHDSILTAKIVTSFLTSLNEKMKTEVQKESEANKKYLEDQLSETLDPWLQRKIQELIYAEIERSMMINTQSFQILEQPMVPHKRIKPNKKMIVLASLMMGLFLGISFAFANQVYAATKSAKIAP